MWTAGEGWLKEWGTPEFVWDRRPKRQVDSVEVNGGITSTRYSDRTVEIDTGDGWIRQIHPDGSAENIHRQ